jgi:hypothetical protein
LRIDAAGYQTKIIRYYDDNTIEYAIRAKINATLRTQIAVIKDMDCEPLLDKQENAVLDQENTDDRTRYCIGDYEKPFTLIIQRKAISGQAALDLEAADDAEEVCVGGYVYRAVATTRDPLSNSQIIHGDNPCAEDSENRIKELKLDFGGDTLPCSDVNADALYGLITALSYNLFALMRQLLPEKLVHHRAVTVRCRLYAMAAKVVKTGRQWYVKLKENHRCLLEQVLIAVREFSPPPM